MVPSQKPKKNADCGSTTPPRKINQRADKLMRKLKKTKRGTQTSIHEQTIHGKGLHTFRMCEVQVPHLLVIARTVYTSGLCFTFAHLTVLFCGSLFSFQKCVGNDFRLGSSRWRLHISNQKAFVTCQLWCQCLKITKYQTNWCLNALVKSLWCPGAPQYHKFLLRPQMFQFSGCGVQVDSNIIIKMRHDKTWIYTNKRIRSPGTCVPLGLCKTNSFAKFAQAEC